MMTTLDAGPLNDELVERAINAYGMGLTVMEPIRLRFWDSRGLTMAQLRLMFLLRLGEARSPRDLAEEMKVRPATLTGLLNRLTRQRLIRRVHAASDRRVVRVSLTPEGRRVLGEFEVAGRAYLREILERMGPVAVARLTDSLEAFRVAAESVRAASETPPRD